MIHDGIVFQGQNILVLIMILVSSCWISMQGILSWRQPRWSSFDSHFYAAMLSMATGSEEMLHRAAGA